MSPTDNSTPRHRTGREASSLSASLLGDELEKRRDQLRATLPIRRVVGPADVATLAVHIMSKRGLPGATYDVDGDQQLVGAPDGGSPTRAGGCGTRPST
jgi:hypothetical protein